MKKTKLIFSISIVIAFLFIINIFLLSIFIPEKNNASSLPSNNNSNNLASNANPLSTLALTLLEVAKHNSLSDCWMIINGKVYDISSYAGSHPGGNSELLKGCGKDATSLYATRGGQGSHSSTAKSFLSSYYIGELNQQISVSALENTTAALKNTTIPSLQGNDDDYEDD